MARGIVGPLDLKLDFFRQAIEEKRSKFTGGVLIFAPD
jgi:hypothetical protein